MTNVEREDHTKFVNSVVLTGSAIRSYRLHVLTLVRVVVHMSMEQNYIRTLVLNNYRGLTLSV